MNYTYSDLLKIAKGQLAMEDEYLQFLTGSSESGAGTQNSELKTQNSKLLFIDTNMYVMKVWCEFVFGKCHPWITGQIAKRKYDLYLLCNTDLPWVKDELREYPDLETRDKLYHIYKNILTNQPVHWADISGSYEERLQKAVKAVDTVLRS